MSVDAPLRTGRRVIAPLALLLLALAGIAAYLWYGRLQADRALEDATLERLRQITAEQPRNARAFHYLGLRLTRARQPAQAFEAHARAAKLDPDDEEIWAAYAGATNAQRGPTEAFRVMDDFLKRHPGNAKLKQERDSLLAILKRGAELFTADKHYNEAIRSYRFWLAEEPDNAQALQACGLLLLETGQKEEAFRTLDSAVRHDPRLADARVALAQMLFEAGFHSPAKAQLREAVKIAPNNAKAWHILGRIAGNSDLQEAETALANAIKNAPNDPSAYLDLASLQVDSHMPQEAEANYRQALKLAPKDPAVLAEVGGFLLTGRVTEERRQEAERLLRQALTAHPKQGDACYHLGRLALDRQEARQAVTWLEKAVALPLETVEEETAWYTLSRAYRQAGEAARAEAARQKSEKLRADKLALARAEEEAYRQPQDPALRLNVARLYAQHAEYVKAISQYQGCLTLDPQNAAARQELDALTARLKASGKMPSMSLFEAMVAASQSVR